MAKSEEQAQAVRQKPTKAMQVFRRDEGPTTAGMFNITTNGPAAAEGLAKAEAAGRADGARFIMLYQGEDFTLLQAWMKPGYPLPLHSHNTDCLYFVSRGRMKLGTVELGAGDGVFMPADVPYRIIPSDEGVEFIEFRLTGDYDMNILANNATFWNKALETIGENRDGWQNQPRPSF